MTNSKGQNVQDELNRMAPAANHAALGDLLVLLIAQLNAVISAQGSSIFGSPGLAIHGSASPVVKSVGAVVATVGGVAVGLAAGDLSALVGTLPTTKSALWAFYVNAAGVVSTSPMSAVQTSHALAIGQLPAVPVGQAMIGFIIVDNATGSNFVGGTTALDAASLTVTYFNAPGDAPLIGAAATLVPALGTIKASSV